MNSFAITAGELGSPCDTTHGLQHFGAQRLEVSGVGDWQHPKHEVHGRELGKNVHTDELPKPALEPVSIDARVLVLGHHEADAGERMKGSRGAHIQRGGARSLPFVSNPLEIGPARQPLRARERPGIRRRRTSTESGRSIPCVPCGDGGRVPLGPTSSPYAHGSRACGLAWCCADDMWACP